MDIARLLAGDASLAEVAAALRSDPQHAFPVLSAKIKLTWRCNLCCRMCQAWQRALLNSRQRIDERLAPALVPGDEPGTSAGAKRGGCELPAPLVVQVLDGLRAYGLRKVHFSGGEVLLHEGFRTIVAHARGLGYQVNLTTNGTQMDKACARFLVDQRVHAVAVSIDDASARRHDAVRGVPGAWKAAWKGLDRLRAAAERKRRGPVLAVNTVVTRQNIDHLDELHALLAAAGVNRWRLLPVDTEDRTLLPTAEQWLRLAARWDAWRPLLDRVPLGWRTDAPERSARRAHKGRYAVDFYGAGICFTPWFNLFIDANGAAYPCCAGKTQMPTFGNVLTQPLEAILASPARRDVQAAMAAGHLFPICQTCDDFLEENAVFRDPPRDG